MSLYNNIVKFLNEDYQDSPEYKELLKYRGEVRRKEQELKANKPPEPVYDYKTVPKGFTQEEWDDLDKFEKEMFIDMSGATLDYMKYLDKLRVIDKEIEDIDNRIDKIKDKEFADNGGNTYAGNLPKKATKTEYEGFKLDTGEYHQDYVENIEYAKSKGYEIVYISEMSPDEYIDRCAKEVFGDNTRAAVDGMENPENVQVYADKMKSGVKFDMPYIDLKINSQEGRHRALAAKQIGIEIIPVLYLK